MAIKNQGGYGERHYLKAMKEVIVPVTMVSDLALFQYSVSVLVIAKLTLFPLCPDLYQTSLVNASMFAILVSLLLMPWYTCGLTKRETHICALRFISTEY